jgi:acyl-CoA synthetase (AMP-forming)/AMP-acid ligase II
LVLTWLGVLAAGKIPLILEYPFQEAKKEEWQKSTRDLVATCSVSLLLCAPEVSFYAPYEIAPCRLIECLTASNSSREALVFPQEGSILQLSAGTTGSPKPLLFSFDEVRTHASLYNSILGMNTDDCMVSWLPLSHCMGLHAGFLMPLLLGIKLVLIDPLTWMKRPQMLFDAVERHGGTTCFMPDAGFKIMAQLGTSGPFPTMRRWVDGSSAPDPRTLERFIHATGANPSTVSTCYGMAENVFAVSHSDGLQVAQRGHRRYLGSGEVIPHTQVKEVSGELFIRSPYSARSYEGGPDIRDDAGFYATGDVGFIEKGQVVVRARKQELIDIEGRSVLLDDLDFSICRLFSSGPAGVASIAIADPIHQDSKLLLLIEDDRFWEREHSEESARLIREAIKVREPEIHFVPPYFLSRTGSGNVDREKTLLNWRANQPNLCTFETASREANRSEELLIQFPELAFNQPLRKELNSVGRTVLQLFCIEHHIPYGPSLTLERIAKANSKVSQSRSEVFSIVALMDGSRLGFGALRPFFDDEYMAALSSAAGMPVHLEQICVPPAPILFSDMIFCDYLLSRNPDPAYRAVYSLLNKIKHASLILVDDEDNFRTPPFCSYPRLDHGFLVHSEADLLGHRTQRYTQNHHRLPRQVVLGWEIKPEQINPTLRDMESYLGIPIVKMAFHPQFRPYTERWDFCDYRAFVSDAEKRLSPAWTGRFQTFLTGFIRERTGQFRTSIGEARNRFILLDNPHFCSYLLNRSAVDFVTERFSSFCIVGFPSSLPYLAQRLQQLGKPYCFCSQLTAAHQSYECIVLTGGSGTLPDGTPVFDFMHAREEGQGGSRPHNVTSDIELLCPPLVACSEQLFRYMRTKYGDSTATNYMYIGNFLLNASVKAETTVV